MIPQRLSAAALAALAGLVPGVAAHAASGTTSTTQGAAAGTVVGPIVLTHTHGAELNFGSFSVGTGGKIDVTAKSVATATRDVTFVPGGPTPTADAFTVAGEKKTGFSITTTGGSVSNGAKSMAFTTTPSAANATTDKAGTFSFTVGGKLTVTGTETAGTYTGSYTATVAYD
jgi:hypothetical protein